jgi:hypothetical protein
MAQKQITIADFLTDDEITAAGKLFKQMRAEGISHHFAKRFCRDVIDPNMTRINRALGQDNDPMFLAYAVEYVMMQACDG